MLMRTDRLSIRVRRGTRAEHDAAQRSGFLEALANGGLPQQAYADLTAQHWFVYEALESAGDRLATDPVVRRFRFPELVRLPAIEQDLRFLYGTGWAGRIEPLPATSTYRARLGEIGPIGFVAHHYTRYIGDLSGGQYLGPAIARSYGLNGDGHRFFVFAEIDPPTFKKRYRALLDSPDWSRAEQDAFVAEVVEAYRLNIAVLDRLKERWS